MMKKRLAITAAIATLSATIYGCGLIGGHTAPVTPGTGGLYPVGWVYSTLYAKNAVLDIDAFQSRVTKEPITVPNGPRMLAIDPRGRSEYLYVVCELANVVAVVDRRNRQVNRTISVGNRPYAIAITPDGRRAFVTNADDDTVSVLELQSQTIFQTIQLNTFQANQPGAPTQQPTTQRLRPQGVAVSADGRRVFVACASGQVVMLEGSTTSQYSATRNILLSGSVSPLHVAVASNQQSEQVFVTDPQGNRLFFFNPQQGNQTAEVRDIQGSPWGLAVGRNPQNPNEFDRLYVTAKAGNALYPFTLPDLSTATPGGQGVSVEGKEPTHVAVSPQGDQVFVSVSGTPTISVFQRVRGELSRPAAYNIQQLDAQFIAPTGDLALAPTIAGTFIR